jgi:hypothetical protein
LGFRSSVGAPSSWPAHFGVPFLHPGRVPESLVWLRQRRDQFLGDVLIVKRHWRFSLRDLLMTAFNAMSHGTQDVSTFSANNATWDHKNRPPGSFMLSAIAVDGGRPSCKNGPPSFDNFDRDSASFDSFVGFRPVSLCW